MKRISRNSMIIMRIIHIIATQIWFGGVVSILVFGIMSFNNNTSEEFLILASYIPSLYSKVILPAALICIIQGVIYGFFSAWGFVKHRWLLLKWMLLPFVILSTGMGGIGQIFTIMAKVHDGVQVVTLYDGHWFFIFSGAQIALLATMTILSVLKPKKIQ